MTALVGASARHSLLYFPTTRRLLCTEASSNDSQTSGSQRERAPKTCGLFELLNDNNESPAIADLDGDGILDAITTSDLRDVVTIAHGLGDGRFGALTSYPAGITPAAVLLGDFDGDGYPDVAIANRIGNSVTVLQARCLK